MILESFGNDPQYKFLRKSLPATDRLTIRQDIKVFEAEQKKIFFLHCHMRFIVVQAANMFHVDKVTLSKSILHPKASKCL